MVSRAYTFRALTGGGHDRQSRHVLTFCMLSCKCNHLSRRSWHWPIAFGDFVRMHTSATLRSLQA